MGVETMKGVEIKHEAKQTRTHRSSVLLSPRRVEPDGTGFSFFLVRRDRIGFDHTATSLRFQNDANTTLRT
jgi:hypothetical protein